MKGKRLKADDLEELELKAVLKHVYDLLFSVYKALDRYELRLAEVEELLEIFAQKYGMDVDEVSHNGKREN